MNGTSWKRFWTISLSFSAQVLRLAWDEVFPPAFRVLAPVSTVLIGLIVELRDKKRKRERNSLTSETLTKVKSWQRR